MGFFDFFTGDWGEATGNWLGTGGDALGIASAFTDGKRSEELGLAAGAFSTLSGVSGVLSGIGKVKEGKKKDGWLDIGDSALGVGGGIADIGASAYGLQAESIKEELKKLEGSSSSDDKNKIGDLQEELKTLQKKKGRWQLASGIIGTLGGIFSMGKSAWDIQKADSTEDKVAAWTGLAGGATKLFSGIGNIGASMYVTDDDKSSDKNFWDNWGKGMSVIGALPGLVNSGLSAYKVAK